MIPYFGSNVMRSFRSLTRCRPPVKSAFASGGFNRCLGSTVPSISLNQEEYSLRQNPHPGFRLK
jgi:hypothetical protein